MTDKAAPPSAPLARIGVLGGGAWGTALAQVAALAGREVALWALEPEVAQSIQREHANPFYLSGVPLSPKIQASADMGVLARCDAILAAAPAQHLRGALSQLNGVLDRPLPI